VGNRGRKEPVCPDEAPNGMRSLAEWLKTRPPRFYYPENPPPPLKRAPNNPKILCENPLDTQFPFLYISLTSKRVLIKPCAPGG